MLHSDLRWVRSPEIMDRFMKGRKTVKWAGKCVELLVVYYQRKQFVQRVERKLQQWQRQQQQ